MSVEHKPAEPMERTEAWKKLWALVEDIGTAMLTTVDDGQLRARPMQGHADHAEGELWFFTKASSHKTLEIRNDNSVNLAYADPQDDQYVSISGEAELVRDRDQIDRLWNPYAAAWFPEGKDDPDVALIRVHVEQAEYWDTPSNRMVQLWELARARASGTEPDMGENRKL